MSVHSINNLSASPLQNKAVNVSIAEPIVQKDKTNKPENEKNIYKLSNLNFVKPNQYIENEKLDELDTNYQKMYTNLEKLTFVAIFADASALEKTFTSGYAGIMKNLSELLPQEKDERRQEIMITLIDKLKKMKLLYDEMVKLKYGSERWGYAKHELYTGVHRLLKQSQFYIHMLRHGGTENELWTAP
jgi:hypothetical protein